MNSIFSSLLFGFILGVKHAMEADHMIAITTTLSMHKNPLRSALIGAFWGIGHTTTLFVVGLIVLLLNITISERVSAGLEMIVGIMLIVLGIRSIRFQVASIHSHGHSHEDRTHEHLHMDHRHHHHRSFIIGAVHGLAGSGALMLLVLATIHSVIEGIFYILIFGLGSILGMSIISLVVGIPFVYSVKKVANAELVLRRITGALSILFGILILVELTPIVLG